MTQVGARVGFSVGKRVGVSMGRSSGVLALTGGPQVSANGLLITATFTRTLAQTFFDYTAFTVSGVSGVPRWVQCSGSTLTLEMTEPVLASETVTLAYTAPADNPLADTTGEDVANFSGQACTNNSTVQSPAEIFDAAYVDGWNESTIQSSGDTTTITGWNGIASAYNLTVGGNPVHEATDHYGANGIGNAKVTTDCFYSTAAGLGDLISDASTVKAFSLVIVWRMESLNNSESVFAWSNPNNTTRFWIFTSGGGIQVQFRADDAKTRTYILATTNTNNVRRMVISFDGGGSGNIRINLDGVDMVNEAFSGNGFNSAFTVTHASYAADFINTAGSGSIPTRQPSSASLRELHIADDAITGSQFSALLTYLASRYDTPRTQAYTTRYELLNSSTTNMAPRTNIMFPALVRAASWHVSPLGTYMMLFASHDGTDIALAYSNTLTSGWTVYASGTDWTVANLATAAGDATSGSSHISSPHIYIDNINERYVGWAHHRMVTADHNSHVAVSTDLISWTYPNSGENLSAYTDGYTTYLRPFKYGSYWYAVSNRGQIMRSDDPDGLADYVKASDPTLFSAIPSATGFECLHSGAFVDGDTLTVYYSQIGEMAPARLLMSTVDLTGDWETWQMSAPIDLAEAVNTWEGTDKPCRTSVGGVAAVPLRELRDPMLFVDSDSSVWLAYTARGESAIGILQLEAAP